MGTKDQPTAAALQESPAQEPQAPRKGGKGVLTRWLNWQQTSLLADRYFEIVIGDWKSTLLLLIQSPVIAALIVMVWRNVSGTTKSLYFTLVLSAFWFGCIDSCREIVKERDLFLRERMFNLEIPAYVLSKVRVLLIFNLIQVGLLQGIVQANLNLRTGIVGTFVILLLATVSGTLLGLLISAVVRKSDRAVLAVPLVMLPQIVFSDFSIGASRFAGLAKTIRSFMPCQWAYEGLVELVKDSPRYLYFTGRAGMLVVFTVAFFLLALPALARQRY